MNLDLLRGNRNLLFWGLHTLGWIAYGFAQFVGSAAYGKEPGDAGSGGSIPLLRTLEQLVPGAEFILLGPEDVAKARIHAIPATICRKDACTGQSPSANRASTATTSAA